MLLIFLVTSQIFETSAGTELSFDLQLQSWQYQGVFGHVKFPGLANDFILSCRLLDFRNFCRHWAVFWFVTAELAIPRGLWAFVISDFGKWLQFFCATPRFWKLLLALSCLDLQLQSWRTKGSLGVCNFRFWQITSNFLCTFQIFKTSVGTDLSFDLQLES